MRPCLALAFCMIPCLPASARDLALAVTWDTPVPAEIVTVLYLTDNSVGGVARAPVGADVTTLDQVLTDLPRQTASVQVALISDNAILAQSAATPLASRDQQLALILSPVLAHSLRAVFDCGDLGVATLTTDTGAAHVTLARNGAEVARLLDDDDELVSSDGLRATRDGLGLTVTDAASAVVTCAPLPAPPVLPVTARAQDGSWAIALGVDQASFTLTADVPDLGTLPADAVTAAFAVTPIAGGAIQFDTDQFALTLRGARCLRGTDRVPYPQAAQLVLADGTAAPDGCAGSPLDLVIGREWYVTTLLGVRVAQDMTLGFATGSVSGRGTCNRYQANVGFDAGRMALRDLGTTRVGCATSLRNLELRFLDALEQANGFDLGPNGTLILRAGPMPVLTARQRAVVR